MPLASAGDYLPNEDTLLLAEWEDAKRLLSMQSFTEKYAVLKYVFSEKLGILFYILGNCSRLHFGRVTGKNDEVIGAPELLALHERYYDSFIEASNEEDESLHGLMAAKYFETWRDAFGLLVEPVTPIRQGLPYKEVLYQCKINVKDKRVLFNLSLLYDLDFSYRKKTVNEPLYFTHVSDQSAAAYFATMQELPYPTIKQMVVLNGNRELYASIKDSDQYTPDQKKRVKVRESIFSKAMLFFENSGGQYIKLTSVDQFEELLSVHSKRHVLQICGHYNDQRLFTEDSYIRLKKILSTISDMRNNGQLRKDVIIDASTCDNYFDFQQLKAAGIPYIYFRNHKITTDIAVLTFLEMYRGFVADRLNWDFPYLNGKTHLHIIYSKINRAFFVAMNLFNQIKTPDIMEKVIIAEGAGLSSFLHYVEDVHEEQGKSPDFKFYPSFDKGLDEKQDGAVIKLLLAGMGSTVAKLILEYLFRNKNNNEITIRGKTEDGKEISITLKNKSEAEVKEFLNSIGFKPDNNQE